MEDKPERRKLAVANLVSKGFGILMVVLFFVLGTTIIFKPSLMRSVPEHYAIAFGAALVMYSFFRAYRLYRRYF